MTALVRSDSFPRATANIPGRNVNVAKVAHVARVVAWTLILLSAIWFLARRWCGAISVPLDAFQLISLAIVLVAVAWGLNLPTQAAASRPWFMKFVPLPAIGAVGLAVSLPGSARLPLAAFWTVVFLGMLSLPAWSYVQRRPLTSAEESKKRLAAEPNNHAARTVLDQSPASEFESDDEHASLADEVTQQITRARLEDGGDAVYGVLRANFAAGERLASVHVGFCPPFQSRPRIEASWTEGPESTVKPAQILPYGARFDVQLVSKPTAATSVLVEFHASTERQEI